MSRMERSLFWIFNNKIKSAAIFIIVYWLMETGADKIISDPAVHEFWMRTMNIVSVFTAFFLINQNIVAKYKRTLDQYQAAMEELRKSHENTKLFASSVVHDLKSPTIGIYGLSKLLKRQCSDSLDEKAAKYCDQILTTAEHISELVQKINAYISTNECPLSLEILDMAQLVSELEDQFSATLSIRKIRLATSDRLPTITADRLSMKRALTNLIDNALKYGGDQLSEIKICYTEKRDFHVLSVKDNGVGIQEEDSCLIFEPFQRCKTSSGTKGSGLGLAIVKEVARRHGGEVWIESDPEGRTEFFLSFSKHPESSPK